MIHFFFISGPEILFIMFVVLMVFGADKIPEIARGLGKGLRQLKDATNDIKEEIMRSAEKQGLEKDILDEVKKDYEEAKKQVEEIAGTMKRKL